jgi:hypothetical protein
MTLYGIQRISDGRWLTVRGWAISWSDQLDPQASLTADRELAERYKSTFATRVADKSIVSVDTRLVTFDLIERETA